MFWEGLKKMRTRNIIVAEGLKELGVSRQQFADETGLSWSTVQRYADGRLSPSVIFMQYLGVRLWMKRRGFKASAFPE